jgi:hypothetical protein
MLIRHYKNSSGPSMMLSMYCTATSSFAGASG